MRTGRFFVRPRLDVFLGQSRATDENRDLVWGSSRPGARSDVTGIIGWKTAVRLRFFLIRVDAGLSPRRQRNPRSARSSRLGGAPAAAPQGPDVGTAEESRVGGDGAGTTMARWP